MHALSRGAFHKRASGGFSGPSGPSPLDVSGLDWWFRADTGIQVSGANVTQAEDLSGKRRHVTQGTDAVRPPRVFNVINGHPVLRFGAAADRHLLFPVTYTRTPQWTGYLVVRHTAQSGYQYALTTDDSGGGVFLAGDSSESAANEPNVYLAGPTPSTSTAMANATNYLVRWAWEQSGPTLNVWTRVNSNAEVSGSGTFGVNENSLWVSLGATSGALDLVDDVAEGFAYSRHVSVSDDNLILAYVNRRYAI